MPQNVLNDHSSAEVRLHKVHYRTRGGFHVRVFLNSPGADANTPTRGNDHYVGQFSMFTGFCIGGPGPLRPASRGAQEVRQTSAASTRRPATCGLMPAMR